MPPEPLQNVDRKSSAMDASLSERLTVLERHGESLSAAAHKIGARFGFSGDDIHDLIAGSQLKLIESATTSERISSFLDEDRQRRYIYGIVRHVGLRMCRERREEHRQPDEDWMLDKADPRVGVDHVVDEELRQQQQQQLLRAIELLPDRQRDDINLALDGCNYQRIAELTGRNRDAVGESVRRATLQLRNILRERSPEHE